ncbi:serine/threonine protein phosphatase 1 [Rhizobium sp. RU35A]|uniref:metallophosphoesterase n=1 Tax=Rhizobium sp. RU35A TaxID=1907414 RepID=UPI0009540BED|nr:metallophosphoesterase [Rhizobium sp. RU35A]SIQ59788.1 serine/threonine protein phosphatase 1 [Rhizobium sp. RU35A]
MTPTESLPSDIYAIADIHGRADLLEAMLGYIAAVSNDNQSPPVVLFLGDLIDRGPHSPKVLDQVYSTLDRYPGSRLILGNHDFYLRELLRGTLTDEDAINWMDWGGVATVSAYSDRPVPDFKNIAADIRRVFPHHADLLENALTFKEIGRFCFVHAGIRPGVQLESQSEHDLRWIRAGFLDHLDLFDHVVLNGHTITKSLRPEVYSNRIALDTGAYRTGRLSAAVIRHDELSHFVCTELTETGRIEVGEWQPDLKAAADRFLPAF